MASPVGIGSGIDAGAVDKTPSSVTTSADDAFDRALQSDPTPEPASTAAPEPTVEAPKEVGSTPTPEATPTAEASPEWTNLISKYKGDQNAAAKAYWETNNRAAQLAKEKEELATKLAALESGSPPAQAPATPTPTPTTQEITPELKRYDDLMLSVEKQFGKDFAEHKIYTQEAGKLDGIINTLKRQLRSNDVTIDKDKVLGQLLESEDAKAQVDQYLAHLDREMTGKESRYDELKANREVVKQQASIMAALNADRQAKEQGQEQAQQAEFRNAWLGTIGSVAKDTSIIPAKQEANFTKFVKAKGKAQVADGEPITDVNQYVLDAAIEFRDMLEEEKQSAIAAYSTQKVADSTQSAPTGSAALAPEQKSPRSTWTPAQWDKHFETNSPF